MITSSLSVGVRDLGLFSNTLGAPALITNAGNLVSARRFGMGVELLGLTKCEIMERVFLLEQQFVLRPNNYPWYCTCKDVVAYAFVVHRRATTVRWMSSAVGDFGANSADINCKSPHSSGKEDRWLTASRFEVLRGDASDQNTLDD